MADGARRSAAPVSDLTDAERQLLALVCEGRVDAEIGVRLGLPVAEVKDRIARLCTRLGASDKAALRTLTLVVPATTDPAAVPSRGSMRRPLLLATLGAVGLLITVGGLVAFRAMRGDAQLQPAIVTIDGAAVPPLRVIPLLAPPRNLALIVERTCAASAHECSGIQAIERVYFDADGKAYDDTLLTPRSVVEGDRIDGVVSLDSAHLLATISIGDHTSDIMRSLDGGVNWDVLASSSDTGLVPVGYMDNGVLVKHTDGAYSVIIAPGADQPVSVPGDRAVGSGPGGEIVWARGDTVIHTESPGLSFPPMSTPVGTSLESIKQAGATFAQWTIPAAHGEQAVAGVTFRTESGSFASWTGVPGPIVGFTGMPGVFTTINTAAAATDPGRNLPAALDLAEGTISPLPAVFGDSATRGAGFVVAAQRGEFNRLQSKWCLSESPDSDAEQVACGAARVLLIELDGGEPTATGWFHLQTPDGHEGWIRLN